MRHGSNSRRSRGRNGNNNNRRGNSKTQIYDSNGPDVRIRGNAFQITEKYMTLARDAASAGDTILAESYYQHAEHYQRVINEFSAASAEREKTPASGDVKDKKVDASSVDKKDLKQGEKETPVATGSEEADKEKKTVSRKKPTRAKKLDTVDA